MLNRVRPMTHEQDSVGVVLQPVGATVGQSGIAVERFSHLELLFQSPSC